MKPRIYVIYGQGGPTFSLGFRAYGQRLAAMGYPVSFWWPRRPDLIIADIKQHGGDVALLGYSLGGNSVSWVADGLGDRPVELVVAFDPTVNSYVTPLRGNVKRAISFRQDSYWGTSLVFGRSALTAAKGGPHIEIYVVREDHLAVQFNPRLQAITTAAIQAIGQT